MATTQFKATTADFIESVVNRSHVPTNQETFPPERLLQFGSEELWTRLVPMVLATQEDYYVTSKDYAGAISVTIPTRAIASKLKDVKLVNADGEERPVTRIDAGQKELHSGEAFYVQGDKIYFLEAPTDTIRAYYHIRPNYLIEESECGKITTVGATSIELDTVPSTFTTSLTYDVVSSDASHKLANMDVSIDSIAGTTVNFTTLPSGLSVGDYFCIAGQSPVVQLPYDLVPVLAQRVAVKALEADGDREGAKAAKKELEEMERACLTMLEPRVEDAPKKIINPYTSSRRISNRYR